MNRKQTVIFVVLALTVGAVLYLFMAVKQAQNRPAVPDVTTTSTTLMDSPAREAQSEPASSAGVVTGKILTRTEVEGNLRTLFQDVKNLEFTKLEDGSINRSMGDLAKVDQDQDKIQSLLNSVAEAYGLTRDQLSPVIRKSGNDEGTLYVSSQYYQGFEVFGGGVQATVNNQTGMAILAGSYLYPVAQIDLAATLDPDEAIQIIKSHYSPASVTVMSKTPRKVVYSMSDPNKAELAYSFRVNHTSKGVQFLEVLVGFTSRSVVYSRKTSHN